MHNARSWLDHTLLWPRLLASRRFRVSGPSMAPTLLPGDRLLIDILVYRLRPPRRGELVVFRLPEHPEIQAVKRIVGLPGEQVGIRDALVTVNGVPLQEPYLDVQTPWPTEGSWRLGPGEYFLLGDNRAASRDSRAFGPVARRLLSGLVWYRYWPPPRRGRL